MGCFSGFVHPRTRMGDECSDPTPTSRHQRSAPTWHPHTLRFQSVSARERGRIVPVKGTSRPPPTRARSSRMRFNCHTMIQQAWQHHPDRLHLGWRCPSWLQPCLPPTGLPPTGLPPTGRPRATWSSRGRPPPRSAPNLLPLGNKSAFRKRFWAPTCGLDGRS